MEQKEYAKNPAKFTLEWAGGEDKGYWKRYDKETGENVVIKSIDFAVVQEAHSISGYSDKFGSCFTNECIEHSEEKHLQIFKKGDDGKSRPEVVLSGPYQSIKFEAQVKYGGKFTAVLYAILLASDDGGMKAGDTVRLLAKGCSLGAWIPFKGKKEPICCNEFEFVCKGDKEDPKSIKFRPPIFKKSELNVGEYSAQRTEVIEFLNAKRLELMVAANNAELTNATPAEGNNVEVEEDVPF